MSETNTGRLKLLTLILMGVTVASSASAVQLGAVELVETAPHSLLALVGMLGLAIGGRGRRSAERS